MQKFEIEGHEPSLLPDGTWKLVWSDEFDGTELDRSKWDFRLNFWGRRYQTFTDKAVELDGLSNVKLHILEKDGQFYSSQLQTGALSFDKPSDRDLSPSGRTGFWPLGTIDRPKFMHRYGYYEVRCKFQSQPGWWSAFWLQSPSIGTSFDPAYSGVEVDIMECFKRDGEVTSGNIYGGYGRNFRQEARVHYKLDTPYEDWHRFGVDWEEDGYVFYCDGKVTARSSAPVSKVEQFILLTTECEGYRSGNMDQPSEVLKNGIILPDCFTVDYVRVFDREER